MKKIITGILFKILGWKTICNLTTKNHPKAVIVAAPHTSNWDFLFTILGFWKMNIKMNFLIKDSFFFFPLGILMKSLGGVPVNRNVNTNLVESAINSFNNGDLNYLVLSAEGTRSYTEKWKSGFYYIAKGAKIPLYLGYIDYKQKVVGIEQEAIITGSYEVDLQNIKSYFEKITPLYPEKFNLSN